MSEEQVAEVSAPEMAEEVAQSVEDWRSSIPEEIRSHRSLQHIGDVGALAKSYVHAQSMIGADKIAIPGKNSSPEVWNEVFTKLGRPNDPTEYQLSMPDSFEADAQMVDWFRATAHELGLNGTQAAKLFDSYNNYVMSQEQMGQADYEAALAETESTLRREWGQAFEDRLLYGKATVEQFGESDLMEVQLADGTMLGDNPAFIKMMGDLGHYLQTQMGEDTLEGVRATGGITPDEAREQLAEIRRDGSPFWNARDPEHDAWVQKALKLQEMIHG